MPLRNPDAEGSAEFEEMQVEEPRRAASITLRAEEGGTIRGASMDVANQSLADALRIVYRLLQVLMIALLILFALSGFQKIDQGQQGIKVTFGRMSPNILEPGPVFSLPYPLGEIIKVSRGDKKLSILDSFWPQGLNPGQASGFGKSSLKPGTDGSVLTGDSNIAHAQLDVSFHRENPMAFSETLHPDSEEGLVRAAVERAMVHVAAEVSIDDLLRRGLAAHAEGASTDATEVRESSLESRIRSRAQDLLDSSLTSGLQIDRVSIREIIPPERTSEDFRKVNDAITNAGKERVDAARERETLLTGTAGTAYQPLLDLIDDYETQLALDDKEGAEAVFFEINRMLDGEVNATGTITIGGREYRNVRLAGDVSSVISNAAQYQTTVIADAQRQAEDFAAKLEQYQANPKQFLASTWYRAFTEFLSRSTVETFEIPDSSEPLRIKFNPDPAFQREIEAEMKRREMERNNEYRRAMDVSNPGR